MDSAQQPVRRGRSRRAASSGSRDTSSLGVPPVPPVPPDRGSVSVPSSAPASAAASADAQPQLAPSGDTAPFSLDRHAFDEFAASANDFADSISVVHDTRRDRLAQVIKCECDGIWLVVNVTVSTPPDCPKT